jgi:hypothetical protein
MITCGRLMPSAAEGAFWPIAPGWPPPKRPEMGQAKYLARAKHCQRLDKPACGGWVPGHAARRPGVSRWRIGCNSASDAVPFQRRSRTPAVELIELCTQMGEVPDVGCVGLVGLIPPRLGPCEAHR